MTDDPLITSSDMEWFGYDAPADGITSRASAMVRRHTRQTVTEATSVARGRSPLVLPQYPVQSVASVVDGLGNTLAASAYTLHGSILTGPVCPSINDFEINLAGDQGSTAGWLTVTYQSGWAVVPDALLELVCAIAARMGATSGVAEAGIRQRQVGGETLTFAAEALSGSLTDREKADLDAFFPGHLTRGPRTVSLDPRW